MIGAHSPCTYRGSKSNISSCALLVRQVRATFASDSRMWRASCVNLSRKCYAQNLQQGMYTFGLCRLATIELYFCYHLGFEFCRFPIGPEQNDTLRICPHMFMPFKHNGIPIGRITWSSREIYSEIDWLSSLSLHYLFSSEIALCSLIFGKEVFVKSTHLFFQLANCK
jgi:hypothetical protein